MKIGLKKLDQLIIKSFIGPFIVTFFLVLFTVTMQFYWLYMDELIGKGLGVGLMMQLLLYMSATLVPMALPLGILLASIMTFGALGENYELVALKSSGISLFRFMRALSVFIILLSIGAFFFNNNVIPVANLKSFSLLYDMRNQKPAMNITPGIFNRDIDGFAIRVGEKDKDGQRIKDVIIYDHSGKRGNNTIVLAENGRMYPSDGGQSLIFELENGWRYEENNDQNTNKQTRMKFGKWYKVFDLSKFSFSRTNEELFKGNHEMMNVWQLGTHIDSFNKQRSKAIKTINAQVMPALSIFQYNYKDSLIVNLMDKSSSNPLAYKDNFSEIIPDSLKFKTFQNTESSIKNIHRSILFALTDVSFQKEKVNQFQIQWHKKFTLSTACILLFLIGAPLGAIIRKGGLGMPVVVAIGFFIIYFIISSTGEKLASQYAVSPWYGLWLSTFVLIPIATFILWQARDDSPIFSKESYFRMWSKVKRFLTKKNLK